MNSVTTVNSKVIPLSESPVPNNLKSWSYSCAKRGKQCPQAHAPIPCEVRRSLHWGDAPLVPEN